MRNNIFTTVCSSVTAFQLSIRCAIKTSNFYKIFQITIFLIKTRPSSTLYVDQRFLKSYVLYVKRMYVRMFFCMFCKSYVLHILTFCMYNHSHI